MGGNGGSTAGGGGGGGGGFGVGALGVGANGGNGEQDGSGGRMSGALPGGYGGGGGSRGVGGNSGGGGGGGGTGPAAAVAASVAAMERQPMAAMAVSAAAVEAAPTADWSSAATAASAAAAAAPEVRLRWEPVATAVSAAVAAALVVLAVSPEVAASLPAGATPRAMQRVVAVRAWAARSSSSRAAPSILPGPWRSTATPSRAVPAAATVPAPAQASAGPCSCKVTARSNSARTVARRRRVSDAIADQDGSGGTGSYALLKSGAGTLVLSGTNSYSGGTQINDGTLSVSADPNLGKAGTGISLSGGTLQATASFTAGRTLTLNGTGGTVETDAGTTLTLSNGSPRLGWSDQDRRRAHSILDGPSPPGVNYAGATTVSAGYSGWRTLGRQCLHDRSRWRARCLRSYRPSARWPGRAPSGR